jgi:hypothetical protein
MTHPDAFGRELRIGQTVTLPAEAIAGTVLALGRTTECESLTMIKHRSSEMVSWQFSSTVVGIQEVRR